MIAFFNISDFILTKFAQFVAGLMTQFFPAIPLLSGAGPDIALLMQWFIPYLRIANYFFPVGLCMTLVVTMVVLRAASWFWFAAVFAYEHIPIFGKGG